MYLFFQCFDNKNYYNDKMKNIIIIKNYNYNYYNYNY